MRNQPGWPLALQPRNGGGLPVGSHERSVTVSLPYSRCRPFLRRAVESILGQTHGDLTLIVLNDGDVPEPWDLLADIKDSRLVQFDLDANRGRYFADAVALAATSDQYFLVHDADDWSESDRIALLYEGIREHDAGAAFSAVFEHGEGRQQKRSFGNCTAPPPPRLSHITHHVGLYRTRALRAIGGYYGGFRFGYDTLLVGLLSLTVRLAYTDVPLYHHVMRSDSLRNSAETGIGSSARRTVQARLSALYDQAYCGFREYVSGQRSLDELCRLTATVARTNVTAQDARALDVQSARLCARLAGPAGARRGRSHPQAARAVAAKAPGGGTALTRMGTVSDPDVSVVMPTRHDTSLLPSTLDSFLYARSRPTRLEFVIVDDASPAGVDCAALERRFDLKRLDASIVVVRTGTHIGIPRARNLGARRARADLLFMTDAHVKVQWGWDALVTDYAGGRRILAATIVSEDTGARGYGASLDVQALTVRWNAEPADDPAAVPVASSAGLVIDRHMYWSVGGFDPGMIGYGSSPAEFSVRAWLRGADLLNLPRLLVWHRFRTAAERAATLNSDLHLILHNRLRFALLYLPDQAVLTVVRDMAAQHPGPAVAKACDLVAASDVWRRRRLLREQELLTFGWYVRKFGLEIPDGQRAAAGA